MTIKCCILKACLSSKWTIPAKIESLCKKSVISNDRRAFVSPKSLLYLPAVIMAPFLAAHNIVLNVQKWFMLWKKLPWNKIRLVVNYIHFNVLLKLELLLSYFRNISCWHNSIQNHVNGQWFKGDSYVEKGFLSFRTYHIQGHIPGRRPWKFYCYKKYRVTRRVFSKSVTLKLHILFQKILAGSLKTLKITRISAMYTNFSHPPVHSGPSKFSRPKIWKWSLGNTKANKNLVNDWTTS